MITQELLEDMLARLQEVSDQLDQAEQDADSAFSHAEDLANAVASIRSDFADLQEVFEKALGEIGTDIPVIPVITDGPLSKVMKESEGNTTL